MIRIENYRSENQGSTIAIFDIYLEKLQLTLRNWKLIRTKKGQLFVSAPAFGQPHPTDEFVKKTWIPYVEWSEERNKDFQAKVLEAVRPLHEASGA